MINPAALERIKSTDPDPKFRAYVVGHEGESKGSVSFDQIKWTKVVKKWFSSAIRNLHEKINLGIPLFHRHSTASTRETIGEVVGKKISDIGGVLTVIVATYIKPMFKALPLDIASIEADITLEEGGGDLIADVDDVHGIALASSKVEKPGFPGAQLLTQLFEFAEISDKEKGTMEITLGDIRNAIREGKLSPSDIFSPTDLMVDPIIEKQINKRAAEISSAEKDGRERTDAAFKTKEKEWEDEKKTLTEENSTLKQGNAKSQFPGLLKKATTDRKLSDKQVKYIENQEDNFAVKDHEKIGDEFSSWVDNKVTDFRKISKDVFGVDVEEKGNEEKGNEGEGSGSSGSDKDNQFIP